MKITDILDDLRWYERFVETSMMALNDLYSENKKFGYDDERLDEMIEASEDIVKRLKELREFRNRDLTEKETGA